MGSTDFNFKQVKSKVTHVAGVIKKRELGKLALRVNSPITPRRSSPAQSTVKPTPSGPKRRHVIVDDDEELETANPTPSRIKLNSPDARHEPPLSDPVQEKVQFLTMTNIFPMHAQMFRDKVRK